MGQLFDLVAINSAIIAGLASSITALATLVYAMTSERLKLKQMQEERFVAVLASDNLTEVGDYFDKVIGNFNIYEYVSNPDVSNKVDKYIERLQLFVGSDADLEQQIAETQKTRVREKEPQLGWPKEFDDVLRELQFGETWNALARLRRYIEIALRNFADSSGITLERPLSAGRLLSVLREQKAMPPGAYSPLRYAVTVCNKGIHGLDVTRTEAREAISSASMGLGRLTK